MHAYDLDYLGFDYWERSPLALLGFKGYEIVDSSLTRDGYVN